MTGHVTAAAGPGDVEVVWQRYAVIARWASWAPPIRAVEADGPVLRTGLVGVVHGPGPVRVPFEVLDVDAAAHRWSWRVRVGPLRVRMEHEVLARSDGGSVATLRIDGPGWLAGAYLPVARIALARLTRA